jgi:aromatic amino acid aminotransferase I
LPSPAYFPFSSVAGEALIPESFTLETSEPSSAFSWLYKLFGSGSHRKEKTSTVTIPKYSVNPDDLSLSTSLQYSPAVALPQLQKIIYDFTDKVYQPAYEDFTTLVHTGNTDGFVFSNTLSQPNINNTESFQLA